MRPLDNHVDVVDVDALAQAAVNPREVLVDLEDHYVGLVERRAGRSVGNREVEVAVLVHGRHAHHGDVHRQEVLIVGAQIAEDHRVEVAQAAVAELALIAGHVPAVIDKVFARGVALHHLDGFKNQIAADFHAAQLILASGNRLVHQRRERAAHGDVDPVTALDNAGRLVRRTELALIF